jgi:hypothetical protein
MKPADTFGDLILTFLASLQINHSLPQGVTVLNPYQQNETALLVRQFYKKFYDDRAPRRIVIGINPGRLGGGLTGIPFTDPIRLETSCGIANTLPKKQELSSRFIYEVIDAYGGPVSFYSKYYFSSVSPLGFIRDGKNMNYYDDPSLEKILSPFIIRCMEQQLEWNIDRSAAYCLGEGKNYRYLLKLNEAHGFFDAIIPLPHPRFIMQYRRKEKSKHMAQYVRTFTRGTDAS